MKFEDALKSIKGAESVGGQLIVNRHGRNVLVGKNVQGTLIVEDEDEAKGIAREVDEKAYEDGREVSEFEDDHSILSTHPAAAALRSTEPMPNVEGDDAQHLTPASAGGEDDPDAEAQTRRDAQRPAKDEGKTHEARFEDRVETKDKASTNKK